MHRVNVATIAIALLLAAGGVLGLHGRAEAPPLALYSVHCTATVTVTTTTETSACTLSGINAEAGQVVRVSYVAQMTMGTGATAVTPRVRRGTGVAGTAVGPTNALTTAAGNTATVAGQVEDSPGAVAGFSYSVTVQQTAATGNGSVLDTEVFASVL